MQHITDSMVDSLVTAQAAQTVLHDAFCAFGLGQAAMQARIRTDVGPIKLSTLGAVIPTQGWVGAKVYTTIEGQFNFVILLFSIETGLPVATFDAASITRLRTAACSTLVARQLARPDSKVLGLFGAGTQGIEHAGQLSQTFGLEQLLVHDPYMPDEKLKQLSDLCGIAVRTALPEEIAASADIIVTASRSTVPLFSGISLKQGTFIAAIGSSLPYTRELDDTTLSRASAIVVEWKPQSQCEAGDLVLADPSIDVGQKTVEIAQVLSGQTKRCSADDIYLYKSVGVGLEDIALAGYAYQRFEQVHGTPERADRSGSSKTHLVD